jgi:DNA mismatch repair protein MutS
MVCGRGIEMPKYTPMMEQYLAIKAEYPDTLLFFRLGDFYELFFEDAILASRELEITLTGRDAGAEERIPMCGVPYHSVDSYLQQLIKKDYKVAICEQVEDPKEAKGVVRREVVQIVTPGTIMEGKMLSEDENNYLVAAWIMDEQFALAACDLSTGDFHCTECGAIETLVSEVNSFHPREILINPNPLEQQFSEKCRLVSGKRVEMYATDTENLFSFLDQFPKKETQDLTEPMSFAVGFLLSYLHGTQKRSLTHIQSLEIYHTEKYMLIDPGSKRNLELTETLVEKKKRGSLLWYLDQTVTAMGARLLRKWIDKPLLNQKEIEYRLDVIDFFVGNFLLLGDLRNLLKSIYDLERLAGRIAFGNANAKDLVNVKQSLQMIPILKQMFSTDGQAPSSLLMRISALDECEDLVLAIEQAIVDDPPLSLKDGGVIKEGYDPYLDKLKTASRDGKRWISSLEQKERELTGIRSLKVGYNKVFGYYIEVTKANLATLPEGRYERKQTLANAERFITPELKEKEALILEAEEKLVELEHELFSQIRNQLVLEVGRIQKLAKEIAAIDVLGALAVVAKEQNLVRPIFAADSEICIKAGRHPVVEKVLDQYQFIPNDTLLDTEKNRLMLITGPNMAGKSTYMRQLVLLVIMAQVGSFVPADEAKLSIVDKIFTRIGAADDLVGGQSTFMVEMNEIQMMTSQATKNSLVIIDEIGRGTSTHDGMAIAQAVIEYIHDRISCKALVSTHYHELAVLEETLLGLKNYHMAVEEEKQSIIFLRKLKRGATSESYGIYCAKLSGLPSHVILRAEELLHHYKSSVEPNDNLVEEVKVNEAKTEVKSEEWQLNLFAEHASSQQKNDPKNKKTEKVLKDLKELDLINLTPLQAMNWLFEIKQKLNT